MNDLVILNNWEKAKQAIANCVDVDEVKQIRDKASALKAYVKQANESLEVQNNVADIKIRCERKIGEFSKELPTQKGTRTDLTSTHNGNKLNILKEAGIKHHERYEAIASLPDDVFEKHIAEVKASNEELTTMGIIRIARDLQKQERNEYLKNNPISMPEDTFQIVYADPAWEYTNSGFEMSAENKYSTMPTCEIKNIKFNTSANSICFLWVTNPLLKDGLEVLASWGFEYKTNFVWTKNSHTAGFYVFGQHELLLIGVKGSMLPTGDKPKSIIIGDNKIHSKKPEIVYEIIEKMYPNMKYLELFSRNKRQGWVMWGNDAPR